MLAPCRSCGSTEKRIYWDQNGQDVVRCAACDAYAYCAPRSETGRAVRTLDARRDLRPRQRSRIFARDLGRCVMCGSDDPGRLDIGHLLSLKEGHALGVPDEMLGADDNLAVMCRECNGWLGAGSIAPVMLARLLRARALRGPVDPALG